MLDARCPPSVISLSERYAQIGRGKKHNTQTSRASKLHAKMSWVSGLYVQMSCASKLLA